MTMVAKGRRRSQSVSDSGGADGPSSPARGLKVKDANNGGSPKNGHKNGQKNGHHPKNGNGHRPKGNNGGHHHHHHRRRGRSNSHHVKSKKELWKGCATYDLGDDVVLQMVGMDGPDRTVYARVDPSLRPSPEALAKVPVGKVIEIMVDEGWRAAAKQILEGGEHIETNDTRPSASELLDLGAVWLLNESAYVAGEGARAHRLVGKDDSHVPEWEDMTLRVHYVPDRHFAAGEVDWGKYCRGLLLDDGASAIVGGRRARVPVSGMPDGKDGVIVYENNDIGFAVLNKPGGVPIHHTISNNTEDVTSMFGEALKQRSGSEKAFVSLPIRQEPEMSGLLLVATKKEFCTYMSGRLELAAKKDDEEGGYFAPEVAKTHRCLVCVGDPHNIGRIEALVGTTVEHWVDVRSPTPKRFYWTRPQKPKRNQELARCLMTIVSTSGRNSKYRAACVSSRFSDSNDFTLAHRLWGPGKDHPAEDLGARYVMELEVRLLHARARPHQMRGQLAALGCPIVGDAAYGGGVCEMRMHRHMWTRMAVQVCGMEFDPPKWKWAQRKEKGEEGTAQAVQEGGEKEEKGEEKGKDEAAAAAAAGNEEATTAAANDKGNGGGYGRRVLVPSEGGEGRCLFNLNTAWWTEYLVDYERCAMPGALA